MVEKVPWNDDEAGHSERGNGLISSHHEHAPGILRVRRRESGVGGPSALSGAFGSFCGGSHIDVRVGR